VVGGWILILAVFALPLALFVAAFVIGCFEKHPVRMFVAAPPSTAPARYVTVMLGRAGVFGFTWRAHGEHTKFGRKLQAELLLSADTYVLAIVGEGKIAKMPVKKTILLSRFADQSLLLTVDEAGTAELDSKSRRQILTNANFEELLRAHYDHIAKSAVQAVPFAVNAGWNEIDEMYRQRADRIVAQGLARYLDGSREWFRYSPRGSFRASIVHGMLQVFRPSNHWRQFKPRPG
jgi:hypothetical protein